MCQQTCLFPAISLLLLSSLGCALRTTDLKGLQCESLPSQVADYFFDIWGPSQNAAIMKNDQAASIYKGTHADFYLPQEGILSSKKFGWTTKIKFRPVLLYENEHFALLSSGSDVDVLRPFRRVEHLWYVIRKVDGVVFDTLRLEQNPTKIAVFDDVFYFSLGHNDKKVFCLVLGE